MLPHTNHQAVTERVNEVADRLFAPFSKRLGLESVREWEEAHAAFEERTDRERAALEQQVGTYFEVISTLLERDLDGSGMCCCSSEGKKRGMLPSSGATMV